MPVILNKSYYIIFYYLSVYLHIFYIFFYIFNVEFTKVKIFRWLSEQGKRLSYRNSSWDQNEAVNAVLSARFWCFRNSALGAELLRRCVKFLEKSL